MPIPTLGNGDMVDPRGGREDQKQVRLGGHAAPTRPGNYALSIERTASVVVVKLTCVDEYGAIELYEHMVASAKAGNLNLEIKAAARRDY